jgi:PEP-CTERM motif
MRWLNPRAAAAAATALMLVTASSTLAANPTLLYSFENPPVDPNGPLDGFGPNGGGTTVSQDTVGATNGVNSMHVSIVAGAVFVGAQTSNLPPIINDPSTTAISLDLTVPAGQQFTGGFADIGITEFGVPVDPDNGTSAQAQIASSYQHTVAMAPGTYHLVIPLVLPSNPITFDGGPNGQGVALSSAFGTDPTSQMTPSSIEFYFNKGPTTGANPLPNAALAVNIDNVQAVSDSVWGLSSSDGDWNTANNWFGAIPNAVDSAADFFNSTLALTRTITTAVPQTLGTMRFNSQGTFLLSGAGSITLQTSTGSALLEVDGGTANINVPLNIASNTTITTLLGGASLVVSAPLTINSGNGLTPSGPGNINYISSITLQSNATITFSNFTTPQSLSLATGSDAIIAAHGANPVDLLELNTLSFGGTTNNWQGKLDLNDNTLIVHNTSTAAATTELTQLTNQIHEGFTGGWHGTAGITSSVAATTKNTAIGIELNDNGSGGTLFTTFEGQNVTNTDILVGYTYFGDANLDGVVDANDYLLIDNGFSKGLTGWRNGDFNYDGVINGDDYTLIDNAFNTQGNVVLNALPATALAINTSQIAVPAAVPEPASLGLLGLGAGAFIRRRRRSCSY